MDVTLTKDADKTLCEIYVAYLNRRSDGVPKSVAKDFLGQRSMARPRLDNTGRARVLS